MKDKKNIFHGQFVKTEAGKLVAQGSCHSKFEAFVKTLEVNQTVELFAEANAGDKTLPQLAKVYVCIRELANEVGTDFEDMKLEIKRRSGLCVKKELDGEKFMVCKSFSDCSKEEISLVIETLNKIGDTVGINFR